MSNFNKLKAVFENISKYPPGTLIWAKHMVSIGHMVSLPGKFWKIHRLDQFRAYPDTRTDWEIRI